MAFLRGGNAIGIMIWLVAAAIVRVGLGGWSPADLGVVALLLLSQPFAEWAVHRHVMHARSVVGALRWSAPLRVEHVRHHRDPNDLHFMPAPVVVVTAAAVTTMAWAVTPTAQLAATAVVVLALELLVYAWTHVLIHSDHVGARWLASRRRDHIHHHDVDAGSCFGVVTPIADAVLGTRARNPSPTPAGRAR